ncbi:MAG: response regulator SirA [Verrucomicrobia bacterium]|nr:response regulator SirA [Verrucomicrobiota bacterium]
MDKEYKIGGKTFVLDEQKAVQAYNEKQVINGRDTMTFNLLPLKYQWAYDLYRKMKANHWEPEDVPMQKDLEQWKNTTELSDAERWIIMMGIGYFSAAEGIVGDNIQHVVRELVTAPELKLALGRHAHEENIHADSLLYMISSLGINPHECEAMFEQIETIRRKNEFVTTASKNLRRDLDLTQTENKQELAKVSMMKEAVELEKEFIRDCLPVNSVGLSSEEFCTYIDYIADRRLNGVGLDVLHPGLENPFPWLAETIDVKKEQNFFEGRVTEYQKSSSLSEVSDDEL